MSTNLTIELNKEFKFENIASYRSRMNQDTINKELEAFVSFLKATGMQKNGPLISASYGIEGNNIDIEFMIPIKGTFEQSKDYKIKPLIHIVNALYTKYTGLPDHITPIYQQLHSYIQDHNMHQITMLLIDGGDWSWKGFWSDTVKGAVSGAMGGAIGGAVASGGPGALPGAVAGGIVGAAGGAAAYLVAGWW